MKLLSFLIFTSALFASVTVAPVEPVVRTADCSGSGVIAVNTQLGYETLIRFANSQQIAGAFWGDKSKYLVDWQEHGPIISVSPQAKGAKSDIHIVTKSGDVCTFHVREVTGESIATDMTLNVSTAHDRSAQAVFVTPDQTASGASLQIEERLKEIESILLRNSSKSNDAPVEPVSHLKHDYVWSANDKAARTCGVKAIYHDSDFTYIEAQPSETCALYETKDGKPSLIQSAYKDGRYTVPKIIDDGYLVAGKAKLTFHRES